jgi:protocatechuate 3,4-dioxygenase beta subunit
MSRWTHRQRAASRVISIAVLVAMLFVTTGIGYAAPSASISSRRAPVAKTAPTPDAATPEPDSVSAEVVRKAPAAAEAPVVLPKVAPDGASVVLPLCHGWIHVYKFQDFDGDGCWDKDEPPIEGWKFTLRLGAKTYELTTDAEGHASMQAAVGIWTITEELRVGWSYVLPKLIRLSDGETESAYFGNHRLTLTKTLELAYPDAPEGASFYVMFKPAVGPDVRVDLAHSPDSGTWMGTKVVWWKMPFSLEWWMAGPDGDVLLGSTGRECLDRDAENLFEYDSSLEGMKFNDLDGDGVHDEGEPGLPGWVIHVYPEVVGDIVLSNGGWIAEAITEEDGSYHFSQLPPGMYRVEEVMQDGWNQTLAPEGSFMIADGVHLDGLDFGNTRVDALKKFELTLDVAKPGVTYYAQYTVNSEPMTTDLLSDSDPKLFVGQEDLKWGDAVSAVAWFAVYDDEHIWLGSTDGEVLEDLVTVNAFRYDPIVGGHKFNDLDGDGVWDQGEPALAGWNIQLWRIPGQVPMSSIEPAAIGVLYAETTTGGDGSYSFEGALPGTYYVTEEMQDGWTQTRSPEGTFVIANGTEISTLDFGNRRLFPDLMIEKSVEPTLAARDDTVAYTLTWSNVGEYEAEDYTITDDFDERYMAVVDSNGGVVADGKITWTFAGPINPLDEPMSLTYTLQVLETVPADVTVVENTVVIAHPEDTDLTNNDDDASIEIEPFAPFTEPEPEDEEFLPFTGGDMALLLLVAAASAMFGVMLRRRSA